MFSEYIISRINKLVNKNRNQIFKVAEYIWKNPETGYREWKTTAYMKEQFEKLGFNVVCMDNITGFYADLNTGRPGPALAILSELDSVICAEHPDADPVTGAVHACGHHSQCAYLVGAAAMLHDPEILSGMCGTVRFIAVPAEEFLEIEYRMSLREQGIIKYFGGKAEYLWRGVFNDIDAAIMIHSGDGRKSLKISGKHNGFLSQKITYTGKSAHAGAFPYNGINALYAAVLGIQAINSIRETFRDENTTRVHPIITDGGKAVNVLPETVKLESMVRGSTIESITEESKKINRALAGSALSLGARVRINSFMGYLPLHQDENLNDLARKVGIALFGENKVEINDNICAGSTDMGDLSSVIPVIHPYSGGREGTSHGADDHVFDTEIVYIDSTRFITGLAYALLSEEGIRLHEIKNKYKPVFNKYQDYFNFMDKMNNDQELITYNGNSAMAVW